MQTAERGVSTGRQGDSRLIVSCNSSQEKFRHVMSKSWNDDAVGGCHGAVVFLQGIGAIVSCHRNANYVNGEFIRCNLSGKSGSVISIKYSSDGKIIQLIQ